MSEWEELEQELLDDVAEGLGVTISIERAAAGQGALNPATLKRADGTPKSYTVTATCGPSQRAEGPSPGGGGAGVDMYETVYRVRRAEIDVAIRDLNGFEPADGDTVVHGTTRLRIAGNPGSANSGLDVVIRCRGERKKG